MTPTHASLAGRWFVSALLIGSGLLAWAAAGIAESIAHEREAVATFSPSPERMPTSGWRQIVARLVDRDAARLSAVGEYWASRYDRLADALSAAEADDRGLQVMAANAAFRRSQREAGTAAVGVDELDRAIQSYAAILRNSGFDRDAAYNFEYLARVRDATARAAANTRAPRRADAPPASRAPAFSRTDLPAGPTVHGAPGTHPPPTRGEEFEVLSPMDYGDRENQPQQTPGTRLPRKG